MDDYRVNQDYLLHPSNRFCYFECPSHEQLTHEPWVHRDREGASFCKKGMRPPISARRPH